MELTDQVGLGSLLAVFSSIGVGSTIWMNQRKIRRENAEDTKKAADEAEAKAQARTDGMKSEFRKFYDSLTDRMTKAETKINDFMPRAEIEAKIEHEKTNRTMADEALRRITETLTQDVRSIMIGQGKIEQQQTETSSAVLDLKTTLKEFSREMSSRFDKIGESISNLKH